MAAILDFSKFTFTTEQIRSVKELIFDEVVKSPDFEKLYTIYPNIVFNKEIGFVGKGSLVGVASMGCNPTAQPYNIGTRKITWEPREWEVLIAECKKDLEATAAVYSLKTGSQIYDFIDTDYMAIVVEVLADSIKDFITRVVWFGDTDAKNQKNGGEIADDTDPKFFNLLNGFFKQMEAEATANAKQKVTIEENAGASYAAQALAPAKAQEYLAKMVYGAPVQLRSRANQVIVCTQSFYDAYEQSLTGAAIETMYRNLVDGQKVLTYKGIELVAVPKFDEIIAAHYDTGAKLINPHRAIYTSKDFLALGVDSENSLGDDLHVWYNQDTREVKVEALGKLDAKVINPAMFVLAE